MPASKAEQSHWYIALVANNTERASAERLSPGYEVFVPSQKVVSVWKDGRRRVRDRILLPGKLMVRCTEPERLEMCSLSFVKRFMVDIATRPNQYGRRSVAVVPNEQVERLKFILGQADATVEINNTNLRAGEPVRVIRGPFSGLEGIVAKWTGSTTKLYINIEHLGCASVEVSLGDIERC